jgi:adenylate kinase
MRIILLGAPGSGKGTQSQFINKLLNIPQISTGDILRQEIKNNTKLGMKAKDVISQGLLVSDDIIIDIIKQRLQQPDCANGFLLDGFPRNLAQAKSLQNHNITIDHVIEIAVSDDFIIDRISGRLFHPASGRTYHIAANPPKVPFQDDITNEPLITREDDKKETVIRRLELYHQQTKPLIQFYNQPEQSCKYSKISGIGTITEVAERIAAVIN